MISRIAMGAACACALVLGNAAASSATGLDRALDLDQVEMVGHSSGGYTAVEAMHGLFDKFLRNRSGTVLDRPPTDPEIAVLR